MRTLHRNDNNNRNLCQQQACVQEKKSDVKVVDVECNPLKSKYESLYSSFHVCITVDSADMSRAIELFMAADS